MGQKIADGVLPITGVMMLRGCLSTGVASCSSSVENLSQPQESGAGKVRAGGLVSVALGSPAPQASDPVWGPLPYGLPGAFWEGLWWTGLSHVPFAGSRAPALHFIPEAPGHLCDLGEQVLGSPQRKRVKWHMPTYHP